MFKKVFSTAAILASSQSAAAEVTGATRSLEPKAEKADAPFAKSGKNSKSMNCAETMTYYFNSGSSATNSVKAPSSVVPAFPLLPPPAAPACGQVPAFPNIDVCVGETYITQPTFLFTSPEDASSNSEVDAVGILTSLQVVIGVLEQGILSKHDTAFVFFDNRGAQLNTIDQDNLGAEILTSDLEMLFDGGITSAIVGGTGPYAGIEGNAYVTPATPAAGTTEVVFCVL